MSKKKKTTASDSMILPAAKKNTICQQWRQLPWSNTTSLHYQTTLFVSFVLTLNSTPYNLHLKLYCSHFTWFLFNINHLLSCSLGSQSSCFVLHKALHIFNGGQVWTPGRSIFLHSHSVVRSRDGMGTNTLPMMSRISKNYYQMRTCQTEGHFSSMCQSIWEVATVDKGLSPFKEIDANLQHFDLSSAVVSTVTEWVIPNL